MTRFDRASGWQGALAITLLAWTLQAVAAGPVSEQVLVSGAVNTALTLKVDDLKAFPADQIVSVTVTRRVSDKETSSTLRGVKLTAVLDRAGLAGTAPNDWKHTTVMAVATDGYRAVFSWPELFNTEVGAGAPACARPTATAATTSTCASAMPPSGA
jgi:hypothetical protein